jgi:hypothetical protein
VKAGIVLQWLHRGAIALLVGLLVLLATLPFWLPAVATVWMWQDRRERLAMERPNDPNWRFVKQLGDRAWRDPSAETFAALDGGRWRQLCVVGGYNNPVAEFERAFGAGNVTPAVRVWFERPFPVEEYDLVVIFSNANGNVDALYMIGGGDAETQHYGWCILPNAGP